MANLRSRLGGSLPSPLRSWCYLQSIGDSKGFVSDVDAIGASGHVRSLLLVQRANEPPHSKSKNIEFPRSSQYPRNASEFVRHICRGLAGWRRDEWAYSPLFIWSKFPRLRRSLFGEEESTPLRQIFVARVQSMAEKLEAIRGAAERVAASHGLDVVDVEFGGRDKERILRVTLEKDAEGRARLKAAVAAGAEGLPERLAEGKLSVEQLSGITHEDCAEFSRDFGVLLDVEDLVPGGEYTLEASSPGLDRRLTKPEEFRRFNGSLVKVQTFEPVRKNRHWQGRLAASEGNAISLDLSAVRQNSKSRKTGVDRVEIAFTNIEKAQLIPEI